MAVAAAALVQAQLRSLPTRVDPDGVCLQNTPYTCGPAAAVTALRRLRLPAEESELAKLAFISPGDWNRARHTRLNIAETIRRRWFSSVAQVVQEHRGTPLRQTDTGDGKVWSLD